ncbi:MAG: LytTR family DNA-binding domain-containing protein [Ferruginibacter sp.]
MKTSNVTYPVYTDKVNASIIELPTCKGIMVIPVQQIIRIQSISNYSKLFFKDGTTLVVAKVLHWFQEQTDLFSFVRIHRTHFVNMHYIKSYSGSKIGLLLLQNGEKFSVARRKKAGVSKRLNKLNNFFVDEPVCTPSFNTEKNFAA